MNHLDSMFSRLQFVTVAGMFFTGAFLWLRPA